MHKKKIIFYIILFISIALLIFLSIIVFKDVSYKLKQLNSEKSIYDFIEKNSQEIFTIDKITYFSSAQATSTINSNSSFSISNLEQYTDIAIFINNHAENGYTLENTLKELKLTDIQFLLKPSLGTPALYYKNINDFTKAQYDENSKINDSLNFTISSEDQIDYSTKTLYNNCANPITLSYVNSRIKDDYTFTNEVSDLSYDGSLLKKCNITLNSISCQINFLITIVNNLDETFTCPIVLQIPLSTESATIYDGSLTLRQETNYKFIRK